MFKRLPAYAPPDLLDDPGSKMVEPDTSDAFLAKPGQRLFAGFTFIGQFLDHDITLDTTRSNQQQEDPDATVNFRTARYDLDSSTDRATKGSPALRAGPGQAAAAAERQRCPGRAA